MMFRTHLLFGLLIGLLALPFVNVFSSIVFMIFVMFGSAFADVDHPDSKFGKKVPLVSLFFTHRGFFHSIFAVALFTFLLHTLVGNLTITLGFAIGYASHVILDMFNHQGVMPFHPLSEYRIKGFIKTNGLLEYVLLLLLAVGAVFTVF